MSKPDHPGELYGKAIGIGLMGLAALAADGLLARSAHAAPGVGGWDLAQGKKAFAPDLYSGANIGVFVAAGDVGEVDSNGKHIISVITGNGPGVDATLNYLKWDKINLTLGVTQKIDIHSAGDPQDGVRVAAADLDGDGVADVIVAPASGSSSEFWGGPRKIDIRLSAYSYPQTNGIYVAAGDVDGDHVQEVITGPSTGDKTSGVPQSPVVNLFDFDTVTQKMKGHSSITPYDNYSGGVRVAAGDVDGDGFADVITAPDQTDPGTNPFVEVFTYDKTSPLLYDKHWKFAADSSGSSQGVFVAVGDVDGDGFDDIITGAGPGGSPMVNVYTYSKTLQDWVHDDKLSFQAYDSSYLGGVTVAVGDFNGDGVADVVTGPATAAVPEPTSAAILGVGCMLLARRRRRSRPPGMI